MLTPSRLARGPFFPQRPLCDLFSGSLGTGSQMGEEVKKVGMLKRYNVDLRQSSMTAPCSPRVMQLSEQKFRGFGSNPFLTF
jgi:hypothetical protein